MTTAEVADYLRMKERTVYEMVARQQIPCSRATGKLLFSRALIDAWVEAHTEMPPGQAAAPPRIYAGVERAAARMGAAPVGQRAGGADRRVAPGLELHRARRGDCWRGCISTTPTSGSYNLAADPRAGAARRHRGGRTGRGARRGCCWRPATRSASAGLGTWRARGLRLARRGEGSGSQVLLEALLGRAGLALAAMRTAGAGGRDPGRSRRDDRDGRGRLRARRRRGGGGARLPAALAGRGVRPGAAPARLLRAAAAGLLAFARSEAFARRAAFLGGYDISRLGAVRYNA